MMYEYRCDNCGEMAEISRPVARRHDTVHCGCLEGQTMRLVPSLPSSRAGYSKVIPWWTQAPKLDNNGNIVTQDIHVDSIEDYRKALPAERERPTHPNTGGAADSYSADFMRTFSGLLDNPSLRKEVLSGDKSAAQKVLS